jgi:hypothetical protein
MLITETAPQQAEHFEWLNTIDFYQSYLEIINDRIDALNALEHTTQLEQKKKMFVEKLDVLKAKLHDIFNGVNEHVEETESGYHYFTGIDQAIFTSHHMILRDKFESFEYDVNDFRSAFNEFYVRCI